MNAIKQSFKYGISSALLVILLGGMQACADSPMEPVSSSNARFSAVAPADTVWVGDEGVATDCVMVNNVWQCQGKPR
ncbi:MAG TPA: hypothetical protein VF035_02810 [Longimicrobiales bacterium]